MRGKFTHFISKRFHIWDHFFPIFFSKDSENLKSFDIGLQEVGAKRCLKRMNKWRRKKYAKQTLFPRRFYTLYEQKLLNLRPLLSITVPQGFRKSKKFGHWTLGSGGKMLNGVKNTDAKKILLSKAKFAQQNTFFFARPFYTLY